ncbi:MAG: hypothetical protein HON23_02005 [Rickettsiales bacterium]|nr:hypothetical protein [Rickettsiales bacterium]
MRCLFGEVVDGSMVLNEVGEVVEREWKNLVLKFNDIEVNRYVIMPNHMHGIVNVGAGFFRPETSSSVCEGREDPAPTKVGYEAPG